MIRTWQGKIAGIDSDLPAKILQVETQDSPNRATNPRYQAFCSVNRAFIANRKR
ncbi:MAG: hypothetical protein ACLQB4_03760 [Beijerinckiaceae bacterium]